MLDRRQLARNAPASMLLLACVFLALSLAGYRPADVPGLAEWTPGADRRPPSNPCGPVGAAMAGALFQALGWSSYLVLLGAAVAVYHLFRRRPVPDVATQSAGYALVLAVAASLSQRFLPGLERSPPVGSGGYLGALAASFLEGQFGLAGMLLILAAAGLTGLSLCGETLLIGPYRDLRGRIRRPRPAAAAGAATAGAAGETALSLPPGSFTLDMADRPPLAPRPALARPVGDLIVAEGEPRGLNQPAIVRAGGVEPRIGAGTTDVPAASGMAPGGYAAGVPAAPAGDGYQLPPAELLEPPVPFPIQEHEAKVNARAMLLERTLLDFGYQVRVVQIDTGPVITQFEIELEAGLRVSRIISLADDLAIALAVPSVRIVAPIPGKTTVGIEVPNERRATVKLGDVVTGVTARLEKMKIPLFLGKDVKGTPLAFDLAEMPHLLIAGRTGTGKSVCLNAMILSILMTKRPDEVKLILIDPKMVELSQFKRIPHLMHPVVTDMKKAESLLAWACDKMDERYGYLARAGVRNIQTYNQLGSEEIYARLRPEDDQERARIPTYMPYIVIIADEMADLMMTAAKEVESHIVRLAQKARAVGMHLIIATQKPTVDVITGLIKGNMPARIAFQVTSRSDSRVVLDEMGAEKLLGLGDMLFLIPGTSHVVRSQGTYVSDAEVNRVCQYMERYPVEFSRELVQLQVSGGAGGKDRATALKERDELYEPAIEIIVREGRGSTSLLQRALGIGYGRAARLIDFMAEDGIVGEFKSGSAREVLYSWDEWEALKNGGEPAGNAA
jgi:DNA segregation ATPase FtsK/SpoIIIE, S-DNA-T family